MPDYPVCLVSITARPDGPQAHSGLVVGSWDAFASAHVEPLAFFLSGWDAPRLRTIVDTIRASPWWDRPVWVDDSVDSEAWVDGTGTAEQARAAGERGLAIRRSLPLDPRVLHYDERVLYFLALREGLELQPVCDVADKALYRYPIVAALSREGEDERECLAGLLRRGLLEPAQLVDRTRHCRSCASAHLHYFEVCPHCRSIEIRKALSLHCFACGHVAPEADFREQGTLVCPRCSARLRHIGVDYDRPLTQFACGGCHHVFVESAVLSRCLLCRSIAEPAALDVREINVLRLSARGRTALRADQVKESMAALDAANFVPAEQFRHLVNWTLAAQARHPQMHFVLMLLEFSNIAEFIERQGAARAYWMLDELARRLHELLRTSDVTTRTAEERLWLFLPFSDAGGLAARLKALLDSRLPGEAAADLDVRIAWRAIPPDLRAGDDCERLMRRLLED